MNGFIQIDLIVPMNSGEADLMEWEDKARLYFHGGRSFSYGGQNVLVISSGMGQGRFTENHYQKSLTVSFKAQLTRTQTT